MQLWAGPRCPKQQVTDGARRPAHLGANNAARRHSLRVPLHAHSASGQRRPLRKTRLVIQESGNE